MCVDMVVLGLFFVFRLGKYLQISSVDTLQLKNKFTPFIFVVAAVICFVLAVFVLLEKVACARPTGQAEFNREWYDEFCMTNVVVEMQRSVNGMEWIFKFCRYEKSLTRYIKSNSLKKSVTLRPNRKLEYDDEEDDSDSND